MGNCMEGVAVVQHKLVNGTQMTPTLYYSPTSPHCRTVLVLGKMLGIQFDLRSVNIFEEEHLKPAFTNLNPQHCIPTLVDKGLVLWESRAILTYLISSYAKDDSLYPEDIKTRALIDQRLHFDLGTLSQRMIDYFFPTIRFGAPIEETKRAKLEEALRWLETMMKGREWQATSHFTVADLALCVTVSQIEAFGFDLKHYSRLRQWLKQCKMHLEPFGYDDINQAGAEALAHYFYVRLKK